MAERNFPEALRAHVAQEEDGRWTVAHPIKNGSRKTYCGTGDDGKAEADELADFWNEGAAYGYGVNPSDGGKAG